MSSFLTACYYFIPVFFLFANKGFLKKTNSNNILNLSAFACFCLFTFYSPSLITSAFTVSPDAAALGMSVLALGFLIQDKDKKNSNIAFLFSAVFAVLAIYTKLFALVLLIALPGYILVLRGYKKFKTYGLCLCLCLVMITGIFALLFNIKRMFFYIFTVSISTISNNISAGNFDLKIMISHYLLHKHLIFIMFSIIMIFYALFGCLLIKGRKFQKLKLWVEQNSWYLFFIMSFLMIPASIFGRMRFGGDVNTLSPFMYFLVIAICLALAKFPEQKKSAHSGFYSKSIKFLMVLIIFGFTFMQVPKLYYYAYKIRYLPKNAQKQAFNYSKKYPGRIYFPELALVSILSEGQYYHCGIALKDMNDAGFLLNNKDFKKYIPNGMKMIAFSPGYNSQYVMKYFPEYAEKIEIKELPRWEVYRKGYKN
ncbi:MAG: hypothetical protein ABIG64_03260 [Candidatus Omnitrophota bacterium]